MKRDDRFDDIDRAMSRRVHEVYDNPERHAFYSCYEAMKGERGPRGGTVRGRKTLCFYCGQKKEGHAEVTESL